MGAAILTGLLAAGAGYAATKALTPSVPDISDIEVAEAPTTISNAPAATTETNQNVQAAGREAQLKALRRKGFMSTMKAGETGGFTTNKLGGS